MTLEEILNNNEMNKLLNDSMGKTFFKYKIQMLMCLDEFKQECYLFLIDKIKYYDFEKSTYRTYIPMVIMSCASQLIRNATGQSKDINKHEIKQNTLSLNYTTSFNGKSDVSFDEVIEDEGAEFENKITEKLFVENILNYEGLTDVQKRILKMVYEGKTKQSIAEILNFSVSNVNKQFSILKKKIVKNFSIQNV